MIDLMGYSVLVDNEEQAKKLQEIAFEQDFEWRFGGKKINLLGEKSFQFGHGGEKVITWDPSGEHYQDEHITKKAHFNDLFGKKFTPIAMKCTQEQFDAIVPKLKGCVIRFIDGFSHHKYLVNNAGDVENVVTNVSESRKSQFNRVVHEEWNEEIFLKACGIGNETLEQNEILQPMNNKGEQLRAEAKRRGYTHDNFKCLINRELEGLEDIDEWYYAEYSDSLFTMPDGQGGNVVYRDGVWAEIDLEHQLEKAKAEVARIEKEIENNKIKVGDWVMCNDIFFKLKEDMYDLHTLNKSDDLKKITNPQLIELLEKEMK